MGEGRRAVRTAAFVIIIGLITSACGARLTEAQRAAGAGIVAGGATDDPLGPLPGETSAPGTDPTDPGLGPGVDPVTGVVPGTGPGTGQTEPLTASDVGVTPTEITIATIADVSGVQPGLFKSAHQAVQAAVAMANAEGGINGRSLRFKALDSKVDAGATRTAVLEACDEAFALVGSMSAFDNGGAGAVDDCGIPDMTAITTTKERYSADFTYPTFPNASGEFVEASGQMMKEAYPQAVKKSAQLWLNTSVTRFNAETKRKAYENLGFDFIYTAETQVVEANYTPFVQKMKDRGVEFVTMLSDYQSIVRLTKAMRKQNWRPEVLEWDSVAYSPKFLQEAEGAAEGSYIYLNSAMIEEIDSNPEMQLYAQWLARLGQNAQPDYFGLYAWSTARLFIDLARDIGPDLTREKLIAALKGVHAWGGYGMHAEHDIGRKRPSRCMMFAQIKNDEFVRYKPAKGWACNKGGLHKSL